MIYWASLRTETDPGSKAFGPGPAPLAPTFTGRVEAVGALAACRGLILLVLGVTIGHPEFPFEKRGVRHGL